MQGPVKIRISLYLHLQSNTMPTSPFLSPPSDAPVCSPCCHSAGVKHQYLHSPHTAQLSSLQSVSGTRPEYGHRHIPQCRVKHRAHGRHSTCVHGANLDVCKLNLQHELSFFSNHFSSSYFKRKLCVYYHKQKTSIICHKQEITKLSIIKTIHFDYFLIGY